MSVGEMLNKLAPIIILVGLVLGGIYGGFFTPTEAGAAGAVGALLISLAKRRLTRASFWQVLVQTGHTTS
ncbi:TRAP transporter large permease subunit, partial [Rhizobiaceae sp. 2RAB30]